MVNNIIHLGEVVHLHGTEIETSASKNNNLIDMFNTYVLEPMN